MMKKVSREGLAFETDGKKELEIVQAILPGELWIDSGPTSDSGEVACLDREEVMDLISALQVWVDTGKFSR